MPTYEYICGNCGYEFEQFQSITARPLRKCPECGKANLKRLIGCGSGVIFKGSGFYETDYRSESYTKAEKSEKSGAEKKPAAGDKGTKAGEKSKSGTKNEKGASS